MLDDMEKTISMSQLQRNAERIAKDIERSGTVYRIKRAGKPSMLLIDEDYFESQIATIEFIAQHPNWREELAEGDRQIAAGEYVDLDDLLKAYGREAPPHPTKRAAPARRATGRRKRAGARRLDRSSRRST